MIRVELVGTDLVGLPAGEFSDAYVKLVFPPGDAPYRNAREYAEQREDLAAEHRPALRTYTIRAFDPAAGRLGLDFVYHGDEGLAGPWAAAAQPGDAIMFLGPGGGYAPGPDADWHLLIGDESALPAIAASLERLGDGSTAYVFAEVEDAGEQQTFTTAAKVDVRWVHREGSDDARGEALVAAVESAVLPDGRVHAFVHGEAGFVKRLRHHLRFDRGVPRDMLSISGYWRHGRADEAWRSEKASWNAEVEADELDHAATTTASPSLRSPTSPPR
jgi:NADPH-dependent ferric siderophore reductase